MTECPKCGGPLYDNRADKASGAKSRKWPDFKCQDKSCDWAEWLDKKGGAKVAKAVTPRGPKWTWGTLARTYERSLLLAEKYLAASTKRTKVAPTTADLLAAAATLFIAASRDGVQEAAPKGEATPKAEAAPLDQPPPQLVAAAEDDDLPF